MGLRWSVWVVRLVPYRTAPWCTVDGGQGGVMDRMGVECEVWFGEGAGWVVCSR